MLLEDKVAIVYGAGGSMGGAIARAFADAGASVFLAGRNVQQLETLAEKLRAGRRQGRVRGGRRGRSGRGHASRRDVVAGAGRIDVIVLDSAQSSRLGRALRRAQAGAHPAAA